MKQLVYIEDVTKIIPGFGEFSKGDTTEYSEDLLKTGLFKIKEEKKAGAK